MEVKYKHWRQKVQAIWIQVKDCVEELNYEIYSCVHIWISKLIWKGLPNLASMGKWMILAQEINNGMGLGFPILFGFPKGTNLASKYLYGFSPINTSWWEDKKGGLENKKKAICYCEDYLINLQVLRFVKEDRGVQPKINWQ